MHVDIEGFNSVSKDEIEYQRILSEIKGCNWTLKDANGSEGTKIDFLGTFVRK